MEYRTLGKLVKIQKGKKNSVTDTLDENSNRIIQIEDLRNDNTKQYTNDNDGVEVNGDDLLIAWDGANAGLVGFGKKGYLGSTLAVLRKKENIFHTQYVGMFLRTKFDYFQKTSTGATIPHISRLALEELEVPLPSYANQIRIAHLLEKIESLIAERKRSVELLEELVKAAFYQLFGDPFKIPPSALIYLEEVSIQITDGEHATPVRTDKGIKLLSARNIQNGYLDFSKGVDYIGQNEYERISKRCKPEVNDILMSCSGTIGRVAVVNSNEPFSLVRSVALIKPQNDVLNSYFLMHWLQSAFLQNEINKNSKKSSQANIFTGAIKKLPVYIPDFDLQNQFAGIAQKIEAIKTEQEAQVQVMEELYAAITQKAFAGSLDLSKIPVDEALLPQEASSKVDETKDFKKGVVTDVLNISLKIKDYYNDLDYLKDASSKFGKAFAKWDAALKVLNSEGPLPEDLQILVSGIEEMRASLRQLYVSELPKSERHAWEEIGKKTPPKTDEAKNFKESAVAEVWNICLEIKDHYNDFDVLENASSKFEKAFAKWDAALKVFNLGGPLQNDLQILISDIEEIRASLRQLYVSELPKSERHAWEETDKKTLPKTDEAKNFKKSAVTEVWNIYLEIKDHYNDFDTLKDASPEFERAFAKWDAALKVLNSEDLLPEDFQILVSCIEEIRASLKQLQVSELPKTERLTWDAISFERVAALIRSHFEEHYFNAEMLLRYLEEEQGIFVHYFTSAEQKRNPKYEQADDFLSFVSGALTGQHDFLPLEQVFYNAETENIPGISFTDDDLETLAGKTQKERSGTYFRIKDETTPG